MRLLGILAASLMATACGLSFNPDLPQATDDNDSGQGATHGDGDIGIDNPPDACTQDNGTAGAGGEGGESPESAQNAPEECDKDE